MPGDILGGGMGDAEDLLQQQQQTLQSAQDQSLDILSPYESLGSQQSLGQLAQLSTLGGQNQFLQDYADSSQYRTLANLANQNILSTAEATGSLGSTSTTNELTRVAPTLGQSALSNQLSLLSGLTNIGQNAANAQVGALTNTATGIANSLGQQAQLSASQTNPLMELAGLALGVYSAGGFGSTGAATGVASGASGATGSINAYGLY